MTERAPHEPLASKRPDLFGLTRATLHLLSMLSAGLITTAFAMAAVYYGQMRYHESIMSAYVYHIFPIGAFGVGLLAASGYLLAGWIFDVHLGPRRVWFIVCVQVAAYFAAQYIDFRSHHYVYRETLQPVSFWSWFHVHAMSYVLEGPAGRTPLGPLGYALRLLEILAFAAGAGLLAATLSGSVTCSECACPLKKKRIASIPAGTFVDSTDGGEITEQQVIAAGTVAFDALATIAQADDVQTFLEQVAEFPAPGTPQAKSSRLDVELVFCPACLDATLLGCVVVKRPVTSSLHHFPRVHLPINFAEAIADNRAFRTERVRKSTYVRATK